MPNYPDENSDVEKMVTTVATDILANQSVASETKEQEPQLELTVAGPCNNPEGRYVGLSKKQRDALGVVSGGTAELFADGKSLGIFTVGSGSKELIGKPEFTANDVDVGKQVVVKKVVEVGLTTQELSVAHGIENVPTGLNSEEAKKYQERTIRRMQIVAERFPGVVIHEFMTIPTAVLNQLAGSEVKIPAISQGRVRIGGKEIEIVMVPAGKDVGSTTKAAEKLGIPPELKQIRFRIIDGVMVID